MPFMTKVEMQDMIDDAIFADAAAREEAIMAQLPSYQEQCEMLERGDIDEAGLDDMFNQVYGYPSSNNNEGDDYAREYEDKLNQEEFEARCAENPLVGLGSGLSWMGAEAPRAATSVDSNDEIPF